MKKQIFLQMAAKISHVAILLAVVSSQERMIGSRPNYQGYQTKSGQYSMIENDGGSNCSPETTYKFYGDPTCS